MHEQIDLGGTSRVERELESLFDAPKPDTVFVTELERRLQERATQIQADNVRSRRLVGFWTTALQWLGRRRWAMVALGLLLILALTVVIIGPRQVWAGFQRFLEGYMPGLGFVNLEQAWMLVEPVEMRREGVVLRVEHVVASPERTVVQVETIEGLRHILYPPSRDVTVQELRTYEQAYADFEAYLRLSDGTRLALIAKSLRVGGGILAFPPLPAGADVSELTLEIPRLPLLPADAAPEQWVIPLSLRPAADPPQVQVYALPDASDTHGGITLRVPEVAHSPGETAVHIRVTWDPEVGQVWIPFSAKAAELRDDQISYGVQDLHAWSPIQRGDDAHVLFGESGRLDLGRGVADLGTGTGSNVEDMWVFDPLHDLPYSLTLQVDWFHVYVPTKGMSFTVDLGGNPQVGDRWPLDAHFAAGDGVSIHVTSVQLAKLSGREAEEYPDAAGKLIFEIVPEEQGDRLMETVSLMSPLNSVGGGARSREWTTTSGGWEPDDGPILSWVFLKELPAGSIDVQVSSASVRVRGPWQVTWDIPGAGEGESVNR